MSTVIKFPCRTAIVRIAAHYSVPTSGSPHAAEGAIESRARAAARAAGYIARKSNWRRNSIDNYGGFMIVDPSLNVPVAGFRYDLSAEAVLAWCKAPA